MKQERETQEELKEEMQTLMNLEWSNKTDNFKPIGKLIDKYIQTYKPDKWLDDFRYLYLSERHVGFYEESKLQREKKLNDS